MTAAQTANFDPRDISIASCPYDIKKTAIICRGLVRKM
jgi:hypothetical protein